MADRMFMLDEELQDILCTDTPLTHYRPPTWEEVFCDESDVHTSSHEYEPPEEWLGELDCLPPLSIDELRHMWQHKGRYNHSVHPYQWRDDQQCIASEPKEAYLTCPGDMDTVFISRQSSNSGPELWEEVAVGLPPWTNLCDDSACRKCSCECKARYVYTCLPTNHPHHACSLEAKRSAPYNNLSNKNVRRKLF